MSITLFSNGMTVKELKDLVKDWPEFNRDEEPCEVWIETGPGLTSPVSVVTTLNLATLDDGTDCADMLFSSRAFERPDVFEVRKLPHEERWNQSLTGMACMDYDAAGPQTFLWKLSAVIRSELRIAGSELRELVGEYVKDEYLTFTEESRRDVISMWLQLVNTEDDTDWERFLRLMAILKVKCDLPEVVVRDARNCIVLEGQHLRHIPRNQ